MTFHTRRAVQADADAIAEAHRDSIRSLGPAFYPADVVEDWVEAVSREMYIEAMESGEVFFIALAEIDGTNMVLGFASDYVREGSRHGMSAYVRGSAARRGLGSTLLRLAEAEAIARGATVVAVEASLVGVAFYRANGFVEQSRRQITLTSGRPIDCVFMEKVVAPPL